MSEQQYHTHDLGSHSFLVTGGGGFIGSNLVEYLLRYGAGRVRVLDNFATGSRENIEPFLHHAAFELIEGDIRDLEVCRRAVAGIEFVSHQAALGSVPRSIQDPVTTNAVNIDGFLNMLSAAQQERSVQRFVYAASSSTYGDSKELPKVESRIGKPLSPYAVTKFVNELYADVFATTYGMQTIGLRYFNVFGPRQSPLGAYAAVIPLFIKAALEGVSPFINGDGEQTRDFTFVENVVQANIKALFVQDPGALNQVYNVACGQTTSLNNLWAIINEVAGTAVPARYRDNRNGDIRDSLADLTKIQTRLGYRPTHDLRSGIRELIKSSQTK